MAKVNADKFDGTISIGRPSGASEVEPTVRIQLRISGIVQKFAVVEMPIGQFAMALTGMAECPCEISVYRKNND